jgi:hypothetical protein
MEKTKSNEQNEIGLMRQLLCSIDIRDKIEKELSEKQDEAKSNLIYSFYTLYGKKEIEKMINEQAMLILNEGTSETLSFARGTANGLMIIKDWLEKMSSKSNVEFINED